MNKIIFAICLLLSSQFASAKQSKSIRRLGEAPAQAPAPKRLADASAQAPAPRRLADASAQAPAPRRLCTRERWFSLQGEKTQKGCGHDGQSQYCQGLIDQINYCSRQQAQYGGRRLFAFPTGKDVTGMLMASGFEMGKCVVRKGVEQAKAAFWDRVPNIFKGGRRLMSERKLMFALFSGAWDAAKKKAAGVAKKAAMALCVRTAVPLAAAAGKKASASAGVPAALGWGPKQDACAREIATAKCAAKCTEYFGPGRRL